MIPYEEKALADDFYRDYMTVKRQLYFDECVQLYGLEYFDRRVKMFMKEKARKEKAALAALKAKAEEEEKQKLAATVSDDLPDKIARDHSPIQVMEQTAPINLINQNACDDE
jgi:hypothetical protein